MHTGLMGFPKVFENFANSELLSIYRSGADKLSILINGISDKVLKARPVPGKWSVQEIVFHLLDAELLGLIRIKMVIAEPGKVLPSFNQELWADKMNYNSRSEEEVMEAVRSFYILRDNNTRLLKSFPKEVWNRKGIHVEYGPITLRNLLELYTDHSERHVEQIADRLQLSGIDKRVNIDIANRLY